MPQDEPVEGERKSNIEFYAPKQAKCPLLVVLVLSENPTCKMTSKKITTAKKLALRVCPNQEKFSFPSDCFVY